MPFAPVRCLLLSALLLALTTTSSCGRRSSSPTSPPPKVVLPPSWDRVVDKPAVPEVKTHLTALAQIATEHGNNRASGTVGYQKSVDYVVQSLPAGFSATKQSFNYKTTKASHAQLRVASSEGGGKAIPAGSFWPLDNRPFSLKFDGRLSVASPLADPYPAGPLFEGPGLEQGLGQALPPSSGCQASEFPSMKESGPFALVVTEGGCSLRAKQSLARDIGAGLVVIIAAKPRGCLHKIPAQPARQSPAVPVMALSADAWRELNKAGHPSRIVADLNYQQVAVTTENVIARYTAGQSANSTFTIGAHLDSVQAGPGINDNGSGVAVLLTLAKSLAEEKPAFSRGVTLMFWGAEEDGLQGSTHYVGSLSAEEKGAISGYLNLDMVGTPNFGRFIYGTAGTLKDTLTRYFSQNSLPTVEVVVGGRTDHFPFQQAGLPVAGLYTGGNETKTEAARDLFGGESNKNFDACYHKSCDGGANINETVLLQSYRAVAFTTAVMAGTKEDAN